MGETLNLQFQCNVWSSEIPSIIWTFTNMTSKRIFQISSAAGSLDSRYLVTFPTQWNSILTITDVRLTNHGIYTCLATTGQLSSQASSTLSIQSKISDSILYMFSYKLKFYDIVAPTVVIMGHMNYNESDTAILECEVITFPSPNITWIKRDQNVGAVIINSQRTNTTFTYSQQSLERPIAVSRLMLSSVSSSDNGAYLCHVSTDIPGYYAVSSQFTIYIHGKTLH